MDVEVAVIGLGSVGSLALWELARRGVSALGIEQFQPGHANGAGHGESKIFRSAYAEGSEYVPLLRAALPLWRELEEETGRPLLTMNGGLMIGELDSPFIAGVLRSAREHGLIHEVLDREATERRFPQLRLRDGEHVVWEPRAGVLRPELAVVAATDRARALGARVVSHTRVESVVDLGDRVEIRAGGHIYRAEQAVLGVGAWFGGLFPSQQLPFWVERQVQAWFPVEDPSIYHPERFGIFSRVVGEGLNLYGFPTLDGRTIKVAFHHGGDRTAIDELDREAHPSDIEPLAEVATAGLRGLSPVPVRTQVCMYINTPDDHFVIGELPDAPRIKLIGPMASHGFKFAPVIGAIAADLVTRGRTEHPIGLFEPGRLAALAGIGQAAPGQG